MMAASDLCTVGIEMPSVGEWFEREAGCFHPLANAAMTENHGPATPRA